MMLSQKLWVENQGATLGLWFSGTVKKKKTKIGGEGTDTDDPVVLPNLTGQSHWWGIGKCGADSKRGMGKDFKAIKEKLLRERIFSPVSRTLQLKFRGRQTKTRLGPKERKKPSGANFALESGKRTVG